MPNSNFYNLKQQWHQVLNHKLTTYHIMRRLQNTKTYKCSLNKIKCLLKKKYYCYLGKSSLK